MPQIDTCSPPMNKYKGITYSELMIFPCEMKKISIVTDRHMVRGDYSITIAIPFKIKYPGILIKNKNVNTQTGEIIWIEVYNSTCIPFKLYTHTALVKGGNKPYKFK